MKRRFARLYPLHFFMLLVFLGFAIARVLAHKIGIAETSLGEILPFEAGASEGWSSLLQNLTMTHAFGLSDSLTFNAPSWTVGAEFWTYLVFVSVVLFWRPKRLIDFVLIIVGVASIYAYLSQMRPNINISYDLGFWRCMAGFFTGLLAAAAFEKLRPLRETWSRNVFTVFEALVVLASVLFVIFCGGSAQFFIGPVIFVFILLFAFDGGLVSRFMSHAIFRYLAKISYSVYMVHVIISITFAIAMEQLFGSLPTGWAADGLLIIYLSVVIAVSHFTYRFVEVPGGKFLRGLNWPQKRVAKAGSSV